MSEANRPRRVLAELKWGGDPSAIVWVGNRTIHQYWPLLSGYFRDILLPPQRRADENAVSWTWREPADGKPIGAAELAGVRKRLTADHQLFGENLTRGEASGLRGQGNIDELGTAIDGAIAQLVSSGDDELATFVCRTEQGLRVHSWGARTAAPRTFPDTREREISGQVVAAGKAAARHEVALETAAGAAVAQTITDASGAFRFPNLAPGGYRLKARARKTAAWFPEGGCAATLAGESVSGLVLQDDASEPAAAATRRRPGWWRWVWGAVSVALLLGGGGWIWHRTERTDVTARANERASELNSSHAVAPEKSRSARGEHAGKGGEPDTSRRVTVATGAGRESRLEVRDTSLPTMTVSEKNIVVPASPSLPGDSAGTPSQSGAGIAGSVSGGGPAAGEAGASLAAGAVGDRAGAAGLRAGGPRSREPSEKAPEKNGETTLTETKGMPKGDLPRSEPAVAAADALANDADAAAAVAESTAAANETSAAEAALPATSDEQPAPDEKNAGAAGESVGFAEATPKMLPRGTHREWRVQHTRWRAHQWRDLILPTVPVPAGETESLDALRAQMLAENIARMPATFRAASVRGGVAFSTGDLQEELAWENAKQRGWSERNRAELECERVVDAEISARLVRKDGGVAAEVRSSGHELIVHLAEGVDAWQWFECDEVGTAERFAWRSASDTPLPQTWLSGQRVSVPLTGRSEVARSLAIVDAETGWALVGEARAAASGESTR